MRIVIVGYGEMFQTLISSVLKTQHELVGVFRHDCLKKSRLERFIKDVVTPSDDYNFVRMYQLNEIKAKSVNSPEFIKALEELKVDLILVGSWSEKFSMQTINTPKIACVNIHPSLLPKYRGPNPYLQVILNAEEKTGVTFHQMDVNYDTGLILHQIEVEILNNDTGTSLRHRCCDVVRNEIASFIDSIEEKLKNPISQNEKEATYQHHINLGDSILNFENETAIQIDRRIRALTPWMPCHICYNNEFFTFAHYKLRPRPTKKPAGTIVKKTDNSIFIVCKDGVVIEFSSLRLKRPFSGLITKYYLKKFVKTNTRVDV